MRSNDVEHLGQQLEGARPTRTLDSLLLPAEHIKFLKVVKLSHLKRAELAKNGVSPHHKLLFYGEPGNGKTAAAESLAAMMDLPLYTVRYEHLENKYVGESEKAVVGVFNAVQGKHCIVFFDECDSLLTNRTAVSNSNDGSRNAMINLFLQHLDRLDNRTLFVAATNRYDDIDKAIKRRFDEKLFFDRPSEEHRVAFLTKAIAERPIFKKKQFAAYVAQAMAFDAPSFAELEGKVKNLVRELILRSLKSQE